MQHVSGRLVVCSLAILLASIPPLVQGALLLPSSFSSIGTLNLGAGSYTIDTSGVPTLRDSSNTVLFTGTAFNQGVPGSAPFHGFNPEVAVFTFDSAQIAAGVTITATGSRPLALLSKSIFVMQSTTANRSIIDGRGQTGGNTIGNLTSPPNTGLGGAGGPGGGRGGDGAPDAFGRGEGPGGGLTGPNGSSTRGNGGGFGGFGGNGFGGTITDSSYGDLNQFLQAGSGGGGSGTDLFSTKGSGGGGGGGAIEIGAATMLTLDGEINVSGGSQGGGATTLAGGGSGGGVRLHAPVIDGTGDVFARGGGPVGGPGGGGGGRILVLTADGLAPLNLGFNVNDISTPVGPTPGVLQFGKLTAVPEPSTNLALMVLGACGFALHRRRHRSRRHRSRQQHSRQRELTKA